MGYYYYNMPDLRIYLMINNRTMTLECIASYLAVFAKDNRLSVWHFSILVAILQLAFIQGDSKRIRVSRSKIWNCILFL